MKQLLREMDSAELTEWQAFERLDGPLGPWRDDYRSGVIASTIANQYVTDKNKALTPQDFIPKWDPEASESEESKQGRWKALLSMFGAKRESE